MAGEWCEPERSAVALVGVSAVFESFGRMLICLDRDFVSDQRAVDRDRGLSAHPLQRRRLGYEIEFGYSFGF